MRTNSVFILALLAIPLFTACDDESARITKYTEEKVNSSVALQKLHDVCRNLPYFSTAEPTSKAISRKNNELYYFYKLDLNPEIVMSTTLVPFGWKVVTKSRGLWEDQLEFENGNYWIRISNGNFGETNFSTTCRDTSL